MSHPLPDLTAEASQQLRRAIDLLTLAEDQVRSRAADLACLRGARGNLRIACSLLSESAHEPSTLSSVAALVLKAEVCLAAMDVRMNDLSLRVADALLLELRVKLENRSV